MSPGKRGVRQQSLQQQVYDEIRARIRDGRLQPGDEMPQQGDLAEEFGCSSMPVHQAYKLLVDTGYVTKDGARFRAAAKRPPFVQDVTLVPGRLALEDIHAGDGTEIVGRLDVLIPAADAIPRHIVGFLGLGDQPRAVLRREVYTEAGHVAQIAEVWVSRALAVKSGNLLEPEVLPAGELAELADIGSPVTRLRDEITARLATPAEIDLLHLPAPQAPVLEANRIGYAGDEPVIVHRTVSQGIVRAYDTR